MQVSHISKLLSRVIKKQKRKQNDFSRRAILLYSYLNSIPGLLWDAKQLFINTGSGSDVSSWQMQGIAWQQTHFYLCQGEHSEH